MDAFCVNSGPQRNKCQHKSLCAGSPHSELAIGAVSLCSVLCWEKPRGSLARCECCSGFQGEIAGGCQAVVLLMAGSVKSILSRVPQWPPPSSSHLGFDITLPCGQLSYPHSNKCSHSALPLTHWDHYMDHFSSIS